MQKKGAKYGTRKIREGYRSHKLKPVSYTHLDVYKRQLNEWHSPYPQLAGEVRAAVSDLAALKFEVLQKVGDAVGLSLIHI